MLYALTLQIIYRVADGATRRSAQVRAWAWTRIIAGWPPEVAADMLRNLDSERGKK